MKQNDNWGALGWTTMALVALTGCDSRLGAQPDPAVTGRANAVETADSTQPARPRAPERHAQSSPTSSTPTAKKGGSPDPCGQLSRCCVELAKLPDMESAKPLCQMFWLQDVMIPWAKRQKTTKKLDDEDTRDFCTTELAQLASLWMIWEADHPHSGKKIPAACDYTHPHAGRMPAAE